MGANEYTPYGEDYLQSGATATRKYTGHDWDGDTGLYFAPYRYYRPDTARWLTRDPLGQVDGPNEYGYVKWNPVSKLDPTGLCGITQKSCLKLAKAAHEELQAHATDTECKMENLVIGVGNALMLVANIVGKPIDYGIGGMSRKAGLIEIAMAACRSYAYAEKNAKKKRVEDGDKEFFQATVFGFVNLVAHETVHANRDFSRVLYVINPFLAKKEEAHARLIATKCELDVAKVHPDLRLR